jgi:HAD superfamily hydrolase (TIGR01509 family)
MPRVTSPPLVILDIGATLVQGPARGPAGRIARALGLLPDQKTALHRDLMTMPFGGPDEVAAHVTRMFGGPTQPAERAVADVWAAQEVEPSPIGGALEAVAGLAHAGYPLALASNIWLPYLTGVRRHFGGFFDRWIPEPRQALSFRAGHKKPSPALFEAVLRAAGTPAHRAVVVGDSYRNDMAPAAALGARTVWVLHQPADELNHVVGVINRRLGPPSTTLCSIAELAPATIASVMEETVEDSVGASVRSP